MERTINLDNITIVLNRPRFPENIGAAARAARNMGIRNLMVIRPENDDIEKIMRLATHEARDIVESMGRFDDFSEALSSFHYVVGTTARLGGERKAVNRPTEIARLLADISSLNRIAIVFGPEDRGLVNEEIRLCHRLINIPTADFSSINLAQAVMIVCYELFQSTRIEADRFTPRLATRHELDGMYERLRDVLVRINYILPDNTDYWMSRMRLFLARMPLRAREVSIIRGICRQIDWYGKKCYMDGQAGNPPDPLLDINKEAPHEQ
ncbi:MAG: RNA methyltransferase [Desulfobacteraceae bacterium]|nr:RNA methyltransferase [Desulfobacteraceae bacterium]